MESEDTVFLLYRHDVGSDAHGTEVEQRDESGERNVVVLGESLHEFKAYATSAKVLERKGIVRTLWVENSHSRRHHLVWHVVITNDEIYAKRLGIFYFLDGFDATVKDDNQFYTCLVGKVYSFFADSVSLVISVGDIVIDVGIELLQELIDQSYGSASIYVVIAIDKDALLASHRIIEAVNGYVHILHEEWIDQVGKLRPEKPFGCRFCRNASLDEKLS